jgi:uncharacterized membrane protein YdjX (TVP38/TMEM64 family)
MTAPTEVAPAPAAPWRRVLSSRALLLLAACIAIAVWAPGWLAAWGGAEPIRARWGAAAAFVLVPLQAALGMTAFPTEVVALANGVLYGFWGGALLNAVAWWITAVAQYERGRRSAPDADTAAAFARLPARIARLPIGHPLFLVAGRLFPFGAHLVDPAAGAARVPRGRHAWCAALGVLPGSLLWAGIAQRLLLL